jgi:hypothetical protein
MSEQSTELIQSDGAFSSAGFDHAQRVAKMLSSSSLIPEQYRGNIQNTMIALEMATRIGASPLMVMQNLYIVHGRPSWSSSFIIAALNSCRRFSPLRFQISGEGENMGCRAWAYDLSNNNEKIEGPLVTMKMAKAEGWLDKNGSKWKTMPELMMRYRAAAFFGRLYAPEIMMGMQTAEEVIDITAQEVKPEESKKTKEAERITLMIQDAQTLEDLGAIESGADLDYDQMEAIATKKEQLKTKTNGRK